jgi:hypothetical protein
MTWSANVSARFFPSDLWHSDPISSVHPNKELIECFYESWNLKTRTQSTLCRIVQMRRIVTIRRTSKRTPRGYIILLTYVLTRFFLITYALTRFSNPFFSEHKGGTRIIHVSFLWRACQIILLVYIHHFVVFLSVETSRECTGNWRYKYSFLAQTCQWQHLLTKNQRL